MNDNRLVNTEFFSRTADIVCKKMDHYKMNCDHNIASNSNIKSLDVLDSAITILGNGGIVEKHNIRSDSDFQVPESIGSMSMKQYDWDHPFMDTQHLSQEDSVGDSSKDCITETSTSLSLPCDVDPSPSIEDDNDDPLPPWQSEQEQAQRNDVTPESSERSASSTRFDKSNKSSSCSKDLHLGANPLISSCNPLQSLPLLPPTIFLTPFSDNVHQEQNQVPISSSSEGDADSMTDIDDELSAAEFNPGTAACPMELSPDVYTEDDELSLAEFDLAEFNPNPLPAKNDRGMANANANASVSTMNVTNQGGALSFQQQSKWQTQSVIDLSTALCL